MIIMTVGNAIARERMLATPHDIYAYSRHDLRDNSAFHSFSCGHWKNSSSRSAQMRRAGKLITSIRRLARGSTAVASTRAGPFSIYFSICAGKLMMTCTASQKGENKCSVRVVIIL